MAITHVFAGIPVTDYGVAREWYERLFDRPPDMLPHDTEAAWELAGSGWVYVVADAPRAGGSLLTLLVDDLDERVAGLAARGIEAVLGEPVPGRVRNAEVTDPDGNRVTFAQVG
jgi:catechol 2,3-dioxygenase-like lactoylglutathione lyase family enzyme